MIKVLFLCHGNICRSPMAEFIFKDIIEKEGIADKFFVSSAATSSEELGNGVYYAAAEKLSKMGINSNGKCAVKMSKSDYDRYDYIIAMEEKNVRNILKIIGSDKDKKVFKLLDFADGGDIADPWYSRNFDLACDEIIKGCRGFIEYLSKKGIV